MGKETPRAPETARIQTLGRRITVLPQAPQPWTDPKGIPALRSPNTLSLGEKDNGLITWVTKVADIRKRLQYTNTSATRKNDLDPYAIGILDLGDGIQVEAKVSSRPFLQRFEFFATNGVRLMVEGISCFQRAVFEIPEDATDTQRQQIEERIKQAAEFFSDGQNVDAVVTVMMERFLEQPTPRRSRG